MMAGPQAAFLAALLQSRSAKNVTPEIVARIPAGANGSELRESLRGTDIAHHLGEAALPGRRERDAFLWEYLDSQFSLLEASPFVPADAVAFARAYVRKFDLANIKAQLLGMAVEKPITLLPLGVLHRCGLLEDLAAAESIGEVEKLLLLAGLADFAADLPTGGGSAGLPETAPLDAAFHRHLLAVVRDLQGGTILAQACGVLLDYANLSVLLRAVLGEWGGAAEKQFIAPGYLLTAGEFKEALAAGVKDAAKRVEYPAFRMAAEEALAGPWAAVDEVVARHRFVHLRGLLAAQVAPACVAAWFLLQKEADVQNTRLLLHAAENGLSFDVARRCLVL